MLDGLEFDLTVEDSTESESDGAELEGSQLPVAQSRPHALAPEAVPAPEGVACAGRLAVLATQVDDVRVDIVAREVNCEAPGLHLDRVIQVDDDSGAPRPQVQGRVRRRVSSDSDAPVVARGRRFAKVTMHR